MTSYELLIFDRGARQESSWPSTTTRRPAAITSKCQNLIIQTKRSLGIRASEHTRSRLNALLWRSTALWAGLFSSLSRSRKLVRPHRRCIVRRKARSPRLLLNHVAFAPFATACFHSICTRYLEQTSSHLIGKLKSFVMARMSFGKHVNNPLKWTSTVESSWHELQGAIKRFDPEALGIQPASRGSFAG